MLQAVLSPLQRVFDVPFKRVVTFALKSSLGRFLQHDLHFEQFCVSLSSGHAELHDLELDTAEICRALGAENLPFELVAVRVALVRVEAFGGDDEGLFVHLSGVEIHISPRKATSAKVQASSAKHGQESIDSSEGASDAEAGVKASKRREEKASDNASTAAAPAGPVATKAPPADLELEDPDIDYDDALETPRDSELSQAALDGLNTLGRWIEEYAAGLRIEAVEVSVHVSLAPPSDHVDAANRPARVIVRCPRLLFGGADPGHGATQLAPLSPQEDGVERSVRLDEAFVYVRNESTKDVSNTADSCDETCIARIKEGATALLRTGKQNEVKLTVPSVLAVVDPTAWASLVEVSSAFGVEHEEDTSPIASQEKVGAKAPSAPLSSEQGSEDDDADSASDGLEFFDADDGTMVSLPEDLEARNAKERDVLEGWDSTTGKGANNSAAAIGRGGGAMSMSGEYGSLSIKVVLSKVQIELLYGRARPDILGENPLRSALNLWHPQSANSAEEKTEFGDTENKVQSSEQELEADDFHLRVVTPRALIILRVPHAESPRPHAPGSRRWLSEAMVLDMTDVSVQTGAAARLELQSAPSLLEDGTGGDAGGEAFFEQVDALRSIGWSLVFDFSRVRAVVDRASPQVLSSELAPGEAARFLGNGGMSGTNDDYETAWALVVDGSREGVRTPRLTMSVRRAFSSALQAEEAASGALRLARKSRRAFKRRVHQRRAPGEEGGAAVDPAGDHGLDKDQEPPLYEVMEAVSTHGFCTADTAVRLVCPDALMSIDKVQYHSLNNVLQLVLGSVPSFTRAVAEDDAGSASARPEKNDGKSPNHERKENVPSPRVPEVAAAREEESSAPVQDFWGESPSGFTGDAFDSNLGSAWNLDDDAEALGRAEVCGVVLGSSSSTFFQLCSRGGKVALVGSKHADFELEYSGLELTMVDSKTMAEAQDVTLLESGEPIGYGEEALRPILHSTKWGRSASSSPLLQVYMDASSTQSKEKESNVLHVCVDGLTLQVLPQSTWLRKLADFLTSAPPSNAVGAAHVVGEKSAAWDGGGSGGGSAPVVTYTEVTVEFFDAVLEYHSGERPQNMAIAGLGMVRMSSNVASPSVQDQLYHLTARDLALYISNEAPAEDPNQFACGADATSPFSSIEDFVASMLFAKVASLDMLELFIRNRSSGGTTHATRKQRPTSADRDVNPDIDYEVSVPNMSLYSCTDSFCTLEALVHDFAVELSGRCGDDPMDDEDAVPPGARAQKGLAGDNAILFETGERPRVASAEDGISAAPAPTAALKNFSEDVTKPSSAGTSTSSAHSPAPAPATSMRDDERTASELRNSYLTDGVPDDQLSGPQLRSRHADGQDPDPDAIFVDGFYAVEQVNVISAASAAAKEAASKEEEEEAVGGSQTRGGGALGHQEAAGTWFHVDDDEEDGFTEATVREGNKGSLTAMGAELLMWGDPNSDNLEEMELDEWPSGPMGEKTRAQSFEEEEAEERLAEAQVAEDTKRAVREQEEAIADYASLYKREFPDQVIHANSDAAVLETKSVRQRRGANDSAESDASQNGWYEDTGVEMYPHYMGVQFEAGPGSHVPTAEALAARMEGRASLRSRVARCTSRVVVRDMSVRWCLFGGCDWNSTASTVAASRLARSRQARRRAALHPGQADKSVHTHDKFGASSRDASEGMPAGENCSAEEEEQQKQQQQKGAMPTSWRRERHRLAGRQNDRKLEVVLSHVTALLTAYDAQAVAGPCIAQSVAIAVRDFSIIDLLSTSDIHTMVGEWMSDAQHPRISGSSMLRVALDHVEGGSRDALCVRASILPVKANLDQDSLEFLLAYLGMRVGADDAAFSQPRRDGVDRSGNEGDADEDASSSSSAFSEAGLDEGLMRGLDGDSTSSEGCLTGEDADIVLVENTDWFIESADVRAFKVKLDYRPKRFNMQGLMSGDRLALVNLFAYEGLQVSLRRVELESIRGGWRELWEYVQASWSRDAQRQRHRCLAGVSFPPINKVATLGSGLTNLVLMPLEQYQKDGRVVHGLRRGTASFVRTVAIEALGTFSIAAQTAQMLLEHARDVLSPLPPGAEFGGRRLVARTGAEREGGDASASAVPPLNMKEGLERGADSFTREVKRAAFVLVALPYDELQRTGPTAAVKSVLRGVPIAVIRPLIGATQAMSSTLMGIRNSVDPDARAEEAQKYKSHAKG
ncbi:Autophagy-related protein 2 [Hondaea fermentalgiana]|uniref:Autophagy-related protein 2 n=1 Tax=Hondaea fermentalgiana TaxID=2315210 RepID=A0A2R5GFJ7_9STRA|nr:Autophagy-related protein 2 [Hondaea fermentalgiana]|eukprot:GBG29692.1 Autophagy-related protein 2 [Hondaea fermentalgiana]